MQNRHKFAIIAKVLTFDRSKFAIIANNYVPINKNKTEKGGR